MRGAVSDTRSPLAIVAQCCSFFHLAQWAENNPTVKNETPALRKSKNNRCTVDSMFRRKKKKLGASRAMHYATDLAMASMWTIFFPSVCLCKCVCVGVFGPSPGREASVSKKRPSVEGVETSQRPISHPASSASHSLEPRLELQRLVDVTHYIDNESSSTLKIKCCCCYCTLLNTLWLNNVYSWTQGRTDSLFALLILIQISEL